MHEHTHKEDVAETASGHDASRFDSHHAPVDMSGADMSVRCAGAAGSESRRSSVAFVFFFPPTRPFFRGGARGVASGRKRVESVH